MANKRDDSIGRWWDRSLTLVRGCTWPPGEMPPACARCWARSMARRFGREPTELVGTEELPRSRGAVEVLPGNLGLPLRTKRPTVWACQINYGDLFHPDVPMDFIAEAMGRMTTRHTFVVLTKRPQRAASALRGICFQAGEDPPPNMLLLASCWDQVSVDAACRAFARLPAGMRWGLHLEPLLSFVDLTKHVACLQCRTSPWVSEHGCGCDQMNRPSWIVVGPENGPGARPFDLDWARSVRDQCRVAGVPFYLKGLGRKGGRTLDGREHSAVPWEEDGR